MAEARASAIRREISASALLPENCSLEDMLHTLGKARLARAAATLNARARSPLPALVLMTDDERLPDPLAAARALPRGSMIVVRARRNSQRAKLAASLRAIARRRGLTLLIANDPDLAGRCRADGLHLAEAAMRQAHAWRAKRPHWIITCAVHSLMACAVARRCSASAVFLSPVFATRSHEAAKPLGAVRAQRIALLAGLPVYALGGIDRRNVMKLTGGTFVGLAAIGLLAG